MKEAAGSERKDDYGGKPSKEKEERWRREGNQNNLDTSVLWTGRLRGGVKKGRSNLSKGSAEITS